eukprot:CAMPEP_0203680046 /NCGR_PEP_ID=MMETSP0090-20130426/37813_1 /ASSEMBLY_ACC=CAM_ASM_001088 /TAXON_ID=426623 /ORGANISM="Chaetoceros affinis, Strain CCMP159" /LENGTH=593 /DNA_ID=CAMNT_0050547933 /DNA_START=416 /DNA_END=2197 /DNA_ORIENTATION=-
MDMNKTASTSTNTNTDANTNTDGNTNTDAVPKSIISDEDYDPFTVSANIHKAAQWNQGNGVNGTWDPLFCAQSVNSYIDHLHYIRHYIETNTNTNTNTNDNNDNTNDNNPVPIPLPKHAHHLLASDTTERVLKAMLKMNIPTHILSKKVRSTEKLIGSIGLTQLTNNLSYRLLEANAKAGNVGRTIQLLNIRKSKKYTCSHKGGVKREFELAVQSIISAGLYLRTKRNVFISDHDQPENDNPTRWLDAILVNMSSRDVPVQLDTKLANMMLDCYASTGRNGKALHFFYRVVEDTSTSAGGQANQNGNGDSYGNGNGDGYDNDQMANPNPQSKIRMKMTNQLPPFYKLPSDVLAHDEMVKRPRKEGLVSKLEWEKEKEWSPALTAAFAFADSLTHGACGHEPIELNLVSWNTLVKVCCYRGAIFRALEILNTTMPRKNIEPNVITYNTILAALARMGDKNLMREMLTTMTNKGINCNKYTVKALVDGYLNAGDISGAISLVQDVFNQQRILPPFTTHLKIIEFALGTDLVHEAKRHVYFIQQIWKWKPNTFGKDETKKFQNLMYATQKNPKLSKKALQRLFSYFGAELLDEDFF